MDVAVFDYTSFFEQAMEVVTTLQEDTTLQILNTEVCELQQHYDEVRVTMRSIATMQCLAKLQETKKLLTQVEVAQKKRGHA